MRRLVLQLVLVCLVAANFEVVTDFDDFLSGWPDSPELTQVADSGIPDGAGAATSCDHCCHGAAHFTGAVAEVRAFHLGTNARYDASGRQVLRNSTAPPPLPPPIV